MLTACKLGLAQPRNEHETSLTLYTTRQWDSQRERDFFNSLYHPPMQHGNVFNLICWCLCVSGFWKHWSRELIFGLQVHQQKTYIKFIYQSHHINIKVTGTTRHAMWPVQDLNYKCSDLERSFPVCCYICTISTSRSYISHPLKVTVAELNKHV